MIAWVSMRIVGRLLVGSFVLAWATGAGAQGYPNKPVRLVVGNAPGGSDDTHGRLLCQRLAEHFGQPCIVDNRSGSGGIVARTFVAKSPADGYTLLLAAHSSATSPHLYPKALNDPVKDFAPVSLVAITHQVLVIHPAVPAKTVKEFIALARTKQGKLNFGSTGVGGGPHLNAEMFLSMAKLKATHIPYKGAGAGIYVDLLAGQLDFYIGPISTALSYINAGRVRALGVTGASRAAKLPDVPTIAEAALPGYEMTGWYGVFVPVATPPEIVTTLNAALVKQIASPQFREAYLAMSTEPKSSTPEEMAKRLADDIEKYGRIIKTVGIQPL